LPYSLWGIALETVARLINIAPKLELVLQLNKELLKVNPKGLKNKLKHNCSAKVIGIIMRPIGTLEFMIS
jgi:hypothetical protein